MNEIEKQQVIAEYEAQKKKEKSEHYAALVGKMWAKRTTSLERRMHMAKPAYFRKLKLYGQDEAEAWLRSRFDEGTANQLLELWSQQSMNLD